MESELAKFRRKKDIEQKKEEIKGKFRTVWDSFANYLTSLVLPTSPQETEEMLDKVPLQETEVDAVEEPPKLKWLRFTLLTTTWLLFYIAFLKIEFGAVYFTVSLLLLIVWNTRTSRRKSGEVSAYSVFNKGCESIDGTLKPEHLEKQMLYRSSS